MREAGAAQAAGARSTVLPAVACCPCRARVCAFLPRCLLSCRPALPCWLAQRAVNWGGASAQDSDWSAQDAILGETRRSRLPSSPCFGPSRLSRLRCASARAKHVLPLAAPAAGTPEKPAGFTASQGVNSVTVSFT